MSNSLDDFGHIRYGQTQYGFTFGACTVTRIHHRQDGSVWIELSTPRERVSVYVTPTGLVRFGEKIKIEKGADDGSEIGQ